MFRVIAQSQLYQILNNSYQVKIYQDLDAAEDVVTFRIAGDIRLTRGSSTAKNELINILPTAVDFTILDINAWLIQKMQGQLESKFQAIIYKNGSIYFKGNLLNMLNKRTFTSTAQKVPLKIYDGLTRLKDYKDLSSLPGSITSIAEFVRQILNMLGFNINIKFYMNMYPAPHNSGTAPASSVGAKLVDVINQDSNLSYYDILEKILKQFALTIYLEEGLWIIRQDISLNNTGTAVSLVNYSTGEVTELGEIAVQEFALDDLQYSPQSYYLEPVTKLVLRVESKSPKADAGDIGWINEHFREGSRGWTVEPNTTVEFQNESMRFFNTLTSGRVYQTSTHQFSPDEIPVIKFVCLSSRYMQNLIDEGAYPFISVKYVNDLNVVFWLKEDGTWIESATPNYFVAIQERRFIQNVSINTYIPGYNTVIIEKEIEAPITLNMGFGYITVYLHGGGIPVYNQPYELTAQHVLASVRRKSSDDEIVKTAESLDVTSSISTKNELIVTLPMHDEDPFITPSLYNLYDGSKTRYWMPANKSLLEYLSQELLRYMTHYIEVLDFKLIPNVNFNFTYLKKGSLTGSEKYYLPVYEEHNLIANNRRIVVVERTKKTLTIKTTKEYIIS